MTTDGDPSPADIAEMRKYGWTNERDQWFLPLEWGGGVYRYTLVEGKDGGRSKARVPDFLSAREAWELHRYFHIFFKRRPVPGRRSF